MKLLVTSLVLLGLGSVSARPQRSSNRFTGQISSDVSFTAPSLPLVETKPIAITSFVHNGPDSEGAFNYAFEAENGIQQEAVGETKIVNDTQVIVMKGSYSYVGPDLETYSVDWYADDTGFHASAPHLPKPVPIPFPIQQAAVDAQIKFAEQQMALKQEESFFTLSSNIS